MTTDELSGPPPWAGRPGGPADFVPTQPYVCVGGDSLPRIAELYGHSGEWSALLEANQGHIWGDYNNMQPGLEVTIPADWMPPTGETAPAYTPGEDLSSMTASQLANLAYAATTLAELDAIDAAAAGRVTVTNAVSTRRNELLDQGATA